MYRTLDDIFKTIKTEGQKKKLVVAAAQDEHVLDAVFMARDRGVVDPVLVGNRDEVEKIASHEGYDLEGVSIVHEVDPVTAAITSVKMIHDGEGDILMKGMVDSSSFLRPILSRKFNLRQSDTLSHVGIIELPHYHKVFALTDGALNIAPDLDMKIAIAKNAVYFMRKLGIEMPKVAALGAFELVHQKMQATIDAALLSKMAQRGQIRNCIIEGPMSFDNAVYKQSAEYKGLDNEVGGDADILLSPNIEAANVLYKSIVYFAGANPACVILGASVPAVLTSRTDSEDVKLNSIMLAASVDLSR